MNMKNMHKYCYYYVFIKFYSNKFMQCYPCALCFYWKNIGHNLLFAKYDTLCTSPPACNCSTLFQYRTTLNLNDQFLSFCRTKLSKFIAATLERIELFIWAKISSFIKALLFQTKIKHALVSCVVHHRSSCLFLVLLSWNWSSPF
jgi:hypothetical protein